MDLEVVGRHALLFDDDAMAAFVNSSDALVEWHSLQIDRYDVRHLLSGPLPPRRALNSQYYSRAAESSIEVELDHERYLDLPDLSDHPEVAEAEYPEDIGGYHKVAFAYGETSNSTLQKNAAEGSEYSGYRPPFPVPESLHQNLMLGAGMQLFSSKPPTEKLHQIIARTAIFVSQHGGQTEIVLRVKQGDNPTFGFLMPDHQLHPYFRFLVDHPDLLQSNVKENTQLDNRKMEMASDSVIGGALTLLGSVYGEDEDGAGQDSEDAKGVEKTDNAASQRDSHSLEKMIPCSNDAEKDKVESRSKLPASSHKEKAPRLRKNPSIAASSKTGRTSGLKSVDDPGPRLTSPKKSREPLVVEPPSDLKKLIDKIVEFIVKNGKQFESTLSEQDITNIKFSFLSPADQYHPYYLQVLQRAQESRAGTKNSLGNDDSEAGYITSDLPYEFDRKEKFKMVIGKSKKDVQDLPSKTNQQESASTFDVDAVAAILKAATKGIKNPDLGSFLTASRIANSSANPEHINQDGGRSTSDPIASIIGKNAALGDNENVSPEVHLTKEQKLKAERLKRAKMFVAELKNGPMASGNELRSSSMEPVESRVSWKSSNVDHVGKDREGSHESLDLVENSVKAREGSSGPIDGGVVDGSKLFERRHSVDEEHMDRRLKRKYRSRSERNNEDLEEVEEETEYRHESVLDSKDGVGNELDSDHELSKKKHRSSHEHSCDEDHRKERSHKHLRKKHRSHRHSHKDDFGDSDTEASRHKHSKKKHSSRRSSREEDDEERYKAVRNHKHRSHRSSHEEDFGDTDTDTASDRLSDRKRASHRSSRRDEDEELEDNDKYRKHSKKHKRSRRSSHRSRESRKRRKSHSSRDEESGRRSKHDSSSDDAPRHDEGRKGSHSEKEELEEGEISSKASEQQSGGGPVSNGSCVDNGKTNGLPPSQPSQSADVPDDLRAKIRAMLMATR